MDKQKQIEELANIMLTSMEKPKCFNSATEESDFMNAYKLAFIGYAMHLYNAGCRIMNENAVVLTREEYETLKLLAQDKCHYDCPLIDYPDFESERMVRETTRQETAKKFSEMLKSDVSEDNELHEALNAYLKRDYFEYMDERCKEFTNTK